MLLVELAGAPSRITVTALEYEVIVITNIEAELKDVIVHVSDPVGCVKINSDAHFIATKAFNSPTEPLQLFNLNLIVCQQFLHCWRRNNCFWLFLMIV